jgi:NADH dehydrogenase FAD-containing subunit
MDAAEAKSLESALAVRSRLLAAFEAAEAEPNADARDAWLTICVVTSLPPSLSAKAERSLHRLGVTVFTGRTVTAIDAAGVTLDGRDGSGERIASRAVVWAAGVTASPCRRARRTDWSRA